MRLRISNINKAIEELSSYELSLYIYISKRVDLRGLLTDLIMTDVKDTIGFSKQTFYNCLYSLEQKGFINIGLRNNTKGYEVLMTENKFKSYKDTSNPYMNMYYQFLDSEEYHQLPVQLKRFLLRAYTFITNKKWHITSELLKQYEVTISQISQYFDIRESGHNDKGEKIYHLVFKYQYKYTDTNIPYKSTYHRIKALLNNKKIAFTENNLKSVVLTAITYKDIPSIVLRGIMASELKDSLQPKLVTSVVTILRKKLKTPTKANLGV